MRVAKLIISDHDVYAEYGHGFLVSDDMTEEQWKSEVESAISEIPASIDLKAHSRPDVRGDPVEIGDKELMSMVAPILEGRGYETIAMGPEYAFPDECSFGWHTDWNNTYAGQGFLEPLNPELWKAIKEWNDKPREARE